MPRKRDGKKMKDILREGRKKRKNRPKANYKKRKQTA